MTSFRFAAAAGLLLAAGSASAQRGAPIVQGATSGELAEATQQLRTTAADLNLRLAQLEAENARLNGRVETLGFLLSESRDEMNRLQEDDRRIAELLDEMQDRIDELEARLANAPAALSLTPDASESIDDTGGLDDDERRVAEIATTAPDLGAGGADDGLPRGSLGSISAAALPGEAGPLFDDAKAKLLRFDYAGAELAFSAFLDRFGDDPQAGEALYWLGEVQYQQEAYAESGAAYTQMIQQYPDDPRAADALVKLARSLRLVGEQEKACAALGALPNRYPDASDVTRNLASVEEVRSNCQS
ncbi:MAG: tol-pal system protein YbgF [Pseudomonadota bacterium]